MLQYFNAEQIREGLAWHELIAALREGFQIETVMPMRHHHEFDVPAEPSATLLLMPAWQSGRYLGVKVANVVPGNTARGLPAVSASYLLFCANTGCLLALLEGSELTRRRTAAASALAASYLAKLDASHLLMVGNGSLALNLIQAHAAVRPINKVSIWGRHPDKAEAVAAAARQMGFDAQPVSDIASAAAQADIISCATLAQQPLIKGQWLTAGCHVDLVGAYKPDMRESDDELMRRAALFVDTREGVLQEAGDVMQAIASGAISSDSIEADLYQLSCKQHSGRNSDQQITVFKSVGAAIEDLAAAVYLYQENLKK